MQLSQKISRLKIEAQVRILDNGQTTLFPNLDNPNTVNISEYSYSLIKKIYIHDVNMQ